jgi:hypothetical protein
VASKKQGTSVSACNPIDFVLAAGSVKVPQDLISGINSSLKDFLMRRKNSPGCKRQLIKPSVLGAEIY